MKTVQKVIAATAMMAACLLLIIGSSGAAAATSNKDRAHDPQGSPTESSKADRPAKSSSTSANSDKTLDTKPSDRTRSSDHSRGNAGTTGDSTEPQPLSKADSRTGGANGKCADGPYCSTRDGSASLNGNGNGKATGKPCAGCVGKADNKNPKGQYPNGSDHNAGYECDTNHGIGRTNPAHTGCTTVVPPVTPPVVNPPACIDNPRTPVDECATVLPPAVNPPEVTPPLVSPPTGVSAAPAGTAVLAPSGARTVAAGSVLPNTGSPAGLGLTLLGGLVVLGSGFLLMRRAGV